MSAAPSALPALHGAGTVLGHLNANFDGTGIPEGRMGQAIPIGARILRVGSDFEHYQAGAIELVPLTREQALRRMCKLRGTRYDPQVVDAFLTMMGQPAPE